MSLNLITSKLPQSDNYDALPNGDYVVTITEATQKTTKNGSMVYAELKFKVLNGEFTNRTFYEKVNIVAISSDAGVHTSVHIGLASLRVLLEANHIIELNSVPELVGLNIGVTLGKKEYNGKISNEVKKYKNPASCVTSPVQAPQAQQQSFGQPLQPQAQYQQPVMQQPPQYQQPVPQQTFSQPVQQQFQQSQPVPQAPQWHQPVQQQPQAQDFETMIDDSMPPF